VGFQCSTLRNHGTTVIRQESQWTSIPDTEISTYGFNSPRQGDDHLANSPSGTWTLVNWTGPTGSPWAGGPRGYGDEVHGLTAGMGPRISGQHWDGVNNLRGIPQCFGITGSCLSPYYSLQSRQVSNCLAAHDVKLMSHAFGISDCCFFLNFDALTHLFLQPLACVTEFQLRGRGRTGCISRVRGGDGFETDGYGREWAWKLRVWGGDGFRSDGHGSGSTFVPVQFSCSGNPIGEPALPVE